MSNLPRVEIFERQLPGEQLPQHDAECVHVRRWTISLHSEFGVSGLMCFLPGAALRAIA